jgi:hypothetical protein
MSKQTQQSEFGLGVMGRNFVLNMADHGFSCAGCSAVSLMRAATFRASSSTPASASFDNPNSARNSSRLRVIRSTPKEEVG